MDVTVRELEAYLHHNYGHWANEQGLFMKLIEEIGEVIAVLKKKGNDAVIQDPAVRNAFLTEMADVLMYYTDTLLRYHVSPEEIAEAYHKKHATNMGRNFTAEYKEKYHG